MKKFEQSIGPLNELLILNSETEKLFMYALGKVEDKILKNVLVVAAYERTKFIKSLDAVIRKNGNTPTYHDEELMFDNIKNSNLMKILGITDEQLFLNEIGKAQLVDVQKYKKILNNFEFSDAIEALLESHRKTIVESLYSIEIHKDFYLEKAMYN